MKAVTFPYGKEQLTYDFAKENFCGTLVSSLHGYKPEREGRLDAQSCMGKAPVGVARAAKKHGRPVIAFSGAVTRDAACNEHGIDAFFPIIRTPCSLEEAMDTDNAYANLKSTAEQAFRLIRTFSKNERP